jgi:hypothetical protein
MLAKMKRIFNAIKRSGKRRAFILALVGLLLYALVCYGFPLYAGTGHQVFTDELPNRLPIPDGEQQSLPVPLWQAIQSNILLPQINIGKSSYRMNIRAAMPDGIPYLCHLGAGLKHPRASFYFVDTPNIILSFINCQAYQYLDMPPPGSSVYV